MSNNIVTIVVKYCGGCNPLYDRVELTRRIKELFCGQVRFVPEAVDGADATMIVSGCHVRCACMGGPSRLPSISISSPEDFPILIEKIEAILDGCTSKK